MSRRKVAHETLASEETKKKKKETQRAEIIANNSKWEAFHVGITNTKKKKQHFFLELKTAEVARVVNVTHRKRRNSLFFFCVCVCVLFCERTWAT